MKTEVLILIIRILSVVLMIFMIVCFFFIVYDVRLMRRFFLSDEYRKAIGMPKAPEKEDDDSKNLIKQLAIAIGLLLALMLFLYFFAT